MNLHDSGFKNIIKLKKFLNQIKPVNAMERGHREIKTASSKELKALIIILVLLLSGCGKKGPPVPPRDEIPPPVTDLSWEISDQTLTLSWSVPKVESDIRLEGFKIYRSQKRLSISNCPDCPGIFKPVADILIKNPIKQDRDDQKKMYIENLETDSRYEYKVIGYTENGISSPDSNIVGFDYQMSAKKDPSEVRP